MGIVVSVPLHVFSKPYSLVSTSSPTTSGQRRRNAGLVAIQAEARASHVKVGVVTVCTLNLESVVSLQKRRRMQMQTPEHAAYVLHGGTITRWVVSPEDLAVSSGLCDCGARS